MDASDEFTVPICKFLSTHKM